MLFPIIETESEIQEKDQLRIKAEKSFIAKGNLTNIAAVNITPGLDASPIDVFITGEPKQEWYLDWIFSSMQSDIDTDNNKLYFSVLGVPYTATLASGTYDLTALLAEIQTKMNLVSGGFTVSLDAENKVTFSNSSAFVLDAASKLFNEMGINKTTESVTSFTTERIEYLTRVISLELVDDATPIPNSVVKKSRIKVYSESGDYLFSSDGDLIKHESEIMRWVDEGRSSFLNYHRRAQQLILAYLDEKGFKNDLDEKYTKWDFINKDELKEWSTFLAMKLIQFNNSNAVDDVFMEKVKLYEEMETQARNRFILRVDKNKDGVLDVTENESISTIFLARR